VCLSVCLVPVGAAHGQETMAAPVSQPVQIVQVDHENSSASSSVKAAGTAASKPEFKKVDRHAAPRAQPSTDGGWEFELTPYIWLPSVSGNFRVGDTDVDVDSGGGDFAGNLKGAFASQFEARKGKFAFMIDESYAHLGIDGTARGPLATPYTVEPTMNLFEAGMGYTLFSKASKDAGARPVVSLEVIGGVRVVFVKIQLQAGDAVIFAAPSGNASQIGLPGPVLDVEGSRTFADGFIGNRLKFRPHPKFTVNLNYTVGGGGSKFAWSVNALGDYRFNKLLSVSGGYRVLDINADRSSNPVGVQARFAGLFLGLGLHF
jgi:hypothetical protein